MVQGDGAAGRALSSHAHIDMVSFTGSTRAGVDVAKHAADTVKRVSQEVLWGGAAHHPDLTWPGLAWPDPGPGLINCSWGASRPT
jgi:hypothetical protein